MKDSHGKYERLEEPYDGDAGVRQTESIDGDPQQPSSASASTALSESGDDGQQPTADPGNGTDFSCPTAGSSAWEFTGGSERDEDSSAQGDNPLDNYDGFFTGGNVSDDGPPGTYNQRRGMQRLCASEDAPQTDTSGDERSLLGSLASRATDWFSSCLGRGDED